MFSVCPNDTKKKSLISLWHETVFMLLFADEHISQDGHSKWKVWESKWWTTGCCCWCQRVTTVLRFIAHHEGPPKHTDLCVFLLNWLSLKGGAPQLNVTAGLCLLSVPCWAWAVLPSANSSMWFDKNIPLDKTHSVSASLVQNTSNIWRAKIHLLPCITHNVMNTVIVCVSVYEYLTC